MRTIPRGLGIPAGRRCGNGGSMDDLRPPPRYVILLPVPPRHAPIEEAAMIHNTPEPRRPGLITQLAEVLPSGAFITWWGATMFGVVLWNT